MYILVKDSVPLGLAVNAVGHASLSCYLNFKDEVRMRSWLQNSFKKVTCKVTAEEIEEAKEAGHYKEITESALDNEVVAVAFCPRDEWPECFKKYKLYK